MTTNAPHKARSTLDRSVTKLRDNRSKTDATNNNFRQPQQQPRQQLHQPSDDSTYHSSGNSTNGGIDSVLLWSDNPEAAYFRSMMKDRQRGSGDSLIGESTIAGIMDDQPLSTLNGSAPMQRSARLGADVDNINAHANHGDIESGPVPTMIGNSDRASGIHSQHPPRSSDSSAASASQLTEQEKQQLHEERVAKSWFRFRARKGAYNPRASRPASSPKRPSSIQKNSTYHNLDLNTSNVPGFAVSAAATGAMTTASPKDLELQPDPTRSPSNESAMGDGMVDIELDNCSTIASMPKRRSQSRSFLRSRRVRISLIVCMACLAIGIVSAIAALAVIKTQDASSQDEEAKSETIFEFPPSLGFVESDVPSEAPSAIVTTEAPTVLTAVPTQVPTLEPTPSPTQPPTNVPTQQPTGSPTAKPTTLSSMAPTQSPTAQPTTPVPTANPTASSAPTMAPTINAAALNLRNLILNRLPEAFHPFQNPTSPQYEAMEWLASDSEYFSLASGRRIQRWTMASFMLGFRNTTAVIGGRRIVDDFQLNALNECAWNGVTCNESGQVVEISIRDTGLEGTVPIELSLIESLEILAMPGNKLYGNIPTQLAKVPGLREIQLTKNELGGPIPTEFGDLDTLTMLGVGRNDLTGEIPSELGNMMQLRTLDLASNSLTGEVPSELANVTSLRHVILDFNGLSGPVPDLSAMDSLRSVYLGGNSFTGSVSSLCDATFLNKLTADCREVDCPCCTVCCFEGSGCADAAQSWPPTFTPEVLETNSTEALPSVMPSVMPSAAPSLATINATDAARDDERANETASPTQLGVTDTPTATPSVESTASSTSGPTALPTSMLSEQPTSQPSPGPTSGPSALPTSGATALLTSKPSPGPTSGSSAMPTSRATALLTSRPSPRPTSGPSAMPTSRATALLTSRPSPAPTSAPTDLPTDQPTAKLEVTESPSAVPSTLPTEQTIAVAQVLAAPDAAAFTRPTSQSSRGRCKATITAGSRCYSPGESITVSFENCDALEDDWIGIYPSHTSMTSLGRSGSMPWSWTCGSKMCRGVMQQGHVELDAVDGMRGTFRAFLVRNSFDAPYEGYASSEEFEVNASCM